MSLGDGTASGAPSSDFTMLEGLYQLAKTGQWNEWEFERLNEAVYECLLSSYATLDNSSHAAGLCEPEAD